MSDYEDHQVPDVRPRNAWISGLGRKAIGDGRWSPGTKKWKGMGRTPQAEQGIRVMRSCLMIVILTSGSVYLTNGRAFPPHGNPLVYSLAVSWLIAITIAVVSSAIFFRVNPTLFSLARWEKEGKIYDRAGSERSDGCCFIRRWAGLTRISI